MTFRVTRDADLEIDEEEAQDLLLEMEESLRRRRRGATVRLEVAGEPDDELLHFILTSLQLKPKDAFIAHGPLDLCMYFSFCDLEGYDHLRYRRLSLVNRLIW